MIHSLKILFPTLAGTLLLGSVACSAEPIEKWTIFERSFTAAREYGNPLWDVDMTVEFHGPSGKIHVVDAFWDGGRTWRARFSPDEVGQWTWRTTGSGQADSGLYGQSGSFECVGYQGDNPLYIHGSIELSQDRRHFVHADGTPFFWLADTAWNGVLRSEDEAWSKYLDTRGRQRFTVIQFVSTPWRGGRETLQDQAYSGDQDIRIHPEFFQRRDAKVAAINERGLIAAPVILWALTPPDPGRKLPLKDAVRLARYIVARCPEA